MRSVEPAPRPCRQLGRIDRADRADRAAEHAIVGVVQRERDQPGRSWQSAPRQPPSLATMARASAR